MTDQELPHRLGHLEDRVVAALRAEGALSPAGTSRPSRWLAVAAAAALFVLTAAGAFAVGRSSASATLSGDKYLLLLYGAQTATPAEEQSRVAEYSAWAGRLVSERRLDSAERLGEVARTAGLGLPALDAAPPPLGFFVVRASSLDEASAIASDCPHVKHGGTVVVRKVE